MTDRPEFDFAKFDNLDFNAYSESARLLNQTTDIVNLVIAWHSKMLMREETAGNPDPERKAALEDRRARAEADRESILLADDEQRQRLLDEYRALYRRLRSD